MADTCIVCLGDLAGAVHGALVPSDASDVVPRPEEALKSDIGKSKATTCSAAPASNDPEIIAHLQPCGHDLHNECLRPWVQRCNSCPICRQTFNVVELKNDVYGPCIDTYAVQDKRQEAEIDPGMVVDDDIYDESHLDSCIVCERMDDEEVLLLCDGCNASCHTYCAGLDAVPAGSWFCQFCTEDGTAQAAPPLRRSTRTRHPRQLRRHAPSRQDLAWTGVWQRIWDNLNFDLDFPFDEEQEDPERTREQRRDIEEWRRRFRVAEVQGGAARFRDTAATLLEGRVRAPQAPDPESQEELRAWNAFDKARDLGTGDLATSRGRKRKSPTTSPIEPAPRHERTLKRPRTRRALETIERNRDAPAASTSASPQRQAEVRGQAEARSSSTDGRSFFHSLLKEVETSPPTPDASWPGGQAGVGPSDAPSPSSSSPVSPTLPAYSSPRSRSPSPPHLRLSRPQSPTPLASQVEPSISQRSPHLQNPPLSPAVDSDEALSNTSATKRAADHHLKSRVREEQSPLGPSREQIRSTKAEIQSMVAAALRPAYKKLEIDKDQYTDINRDVSRKLYEKVGEEGGLGNDLAREKWQSTAALEVDVAVKALRKTAA